MFGNLLGGIVAQYASWKWVFVVIGLVASAITAAALFVIPSPKSTQREGSPTVKPSVDWLGSALITGGLLALLFSLTEGNVVGWATPWIPVLIVVSLSLVAIFAFWQSHLEKTGKLAPVMKVSIFRNTQFSAAMVTMALFFQQLQRILGVCDLLLPGLPGAFHA